MGEHRAPRRRRRTKARFTAVGLTAAAAGVALWLALNPSGGGSAQATSTASMVPASVAQTAHSGLVKQSTAAENKARQVRQEQSDAGSSESPGSEKAQSTPEKPQSTPSESRANPSESQSTPSESQSTTTAQAVYDDDLDGWVKQALAVMDEHDIPGTYEGLRSAALEKSDGRPDAVAITDRSLKDGTPPVGLLQLDRAAFAEYHVAGTAQNILDPVANLVAGANRAAAQGAPLTGA
ncbi:hypothetical protein ACIBUY_09750 [Streptomyces sp. NPDC050085]|uniref:hypothetical protein n=1 Tax=Streptomyces sp. NPDC050085 TaxID=3365600 RepID=UPI0037B1348F